MNKKSITTKCLSLIAAGIFISGVASAGEMATPDEAKAMSEKAAAAVNTMGKDKAFSAFSDPKGDYQEKDLYVFCMELSGIVLSHAKNPNLVGKNLAAFNKYGDYAFKDMIDVAQDKKAGWVDQKWPYPGTGEVREKTTYIQTNNEGFFCGVGAYK